MAVSESFVQFISEQLSEFGDFEVKKMFGGRGFFKEGIMFGMIGNDVFRMKVDESNQADYEEKGMEPYYSDSKKKGMPYWEVPPDVIEDREMLKIWAEKAFEVARAAKK